MNNNIFEEFKKGKGISGIKIKDSHMHIGRIYHLPFSANIDDMVYDMDRFNIKTGLISCILRYSNNFSENEFVKQTILKYKGKLKGQIFYAPNVHKDKRPIEEYIKSGIFTGIKIHPVINDITVKHEGYRWLFDMAGEFQLPVLIHTWTPDVDILPVNGLAKEFPRTKFVMGHMGGKLKESFEACLDVVKENDNVFADTALSWAYKGRIETAVNKIGSSKILFGSDANWNSIPQALGRVIYSKITSAQKEDILYKNFDLIYS